MNNELPTMEFTFDLNKQGSITKKVYSGSFTYKRLNIGDQGKADVLRVKLNSDLTNIDPEIDRLHEILGWLKYGLIDYPDWWRVSLFGAELYDTNIIIELNKLINDFEKRWKQQVHSNAGSPRKDSPTES